MGSDAIRYTAALVVSFAATMITGYLLVPALRKAKAAQTIREDGPVWHEKKQGTPTMGGIMFISGIVIAGLFTYLRDLAAGALDFLLIFIGAFIAALIGLIDDYRKIKNARNLGLGAKQKLLLQIAGAIVFILLLRCVGLPEPVLYIPFFNISVGIPQWLNYPLTVFMYVGTVNAVNITDGADGLASGTMIPAAIFFAAAAAVWGNRAASIFAFALTGALIAFLFFNFHPAKVFMGDLGAQFLGGALCAMALLLGVTLILIPIGIVFFLEALSDIIQVTYFKTTHGKRVFKMAPLHHHFEMCGWSERKLFAVFTGVSVLFAVITFLFGIK